MKNETERLERLYTWPKDRPGSAFTTLHTCDMGIYFCRDVAFMGVSQILEGVKANGRREKSVGRGERN